MPPVPTALPARPRTAPFVRDLARHGDRPALLTATGRVSYRELADRVDRLARRLGTERRLVLLAAANDVESLAGYLAALAGGHPVMLAPRAGGDTVAAMIAAYDPDVVLDGETPHERRAGTAHRLHPDLALLMSTSGSTGSAKLVRLSHDNLQANAESIAGYLGISSDDRAATTLPVHYCYGLSVVNSHLLRGAGLVLTDRSVADPEFWELFRAHRATSFAGVPYTFDLLDRVGFAGMALPHLRYVTQAGGRLAPERVRRYAELGERAGWRLFVMYGQTEATARMAYLPPELARAHPRCVGVPVPGGSFRLEPVPDVPGPDTGELVYSGRNVMLGYAQEPADLALGRTVAELRTGDIARRTPEGLYEIVGRRGRFLKVYGLRIDLTRVEAALERAGHRAACAGTDDELVVAVAGSDPAEVRAAAARAAGLPRAAVRVCPLPDLPRLPSGKPDYPAIAALTRAGGAGRLRRERRPADPGTGDLRERRPGAGDLRELYAAVLGLDPAAIRDDDTFAGLGGDSLTYVTMSVRLEETLDALPPDWHLIPIRDLRPARDPHAALPYRLWRGRPRPRRVDTGAALRAIAIVLIVGTHAKLFAITGGAHLLLGVAGFNFARFHLRPAARRDRLRGLGRSIRRVAVASMLWIALVHLVVGDYTWVQLLLLDYVLGPPDINDFWFIETLVYILTALLVLSAVPAFDRIQRRFPFATPMAVMLLGLVTRYHLIPGKPPTPVVAFWLLALGWAAAKATGARQRALVSAAAVATVPGFFGYLPRELVIIAGLLALIWVPTLPSTRWLNRAVSLLAGASLYIYLTHWQIYPRLAEHGALLAVAASLAFGIGYAALATRTARLGNRLATRLGNRLATGPAHRVGTGSSAVTASRRRSGDRSPWPAGDRA